MGKKIRNVINLIINFDYLNGWVFLKNSSNDLVNEGR